MKLLIKGNVPSQKNRKIISKHAGTGRPFLRTAPKVKEWQESAVLQLRSQFKGYRVSDYPIAINIVVWYDSLRRHDLDNALGSIMDALTAAEVITDDDTKHIECITIQYGGHDKTN